MYWEDNLYMLIIPPQKHEAPYTYKEASFVYLRPAPKLPIWGMHSTRPLLT